MSSETFYDRSGRRISRAQWLRLLGDDTYRVLAMTVVGPHRVVTAWLGADQSGGFDDPLTFGTVVHDLQRDEFVHETFRGSESAALLAHEQTVQEMAGTGHSSRCIVCASTLARTGG